MLETLIVLGLIVVAGGAYVYKTRKDKTKSGTASGSAKSENQKQK